MYIYESPAGAGICVLRVIVSVFFYVFRETSPEVYSNFPLFNPLSGNPTELSNTLQQFVGCCRRIVWVCLIVLWGCLKELKVLANSCSCDNSKHLLKSGIRKKEAGKILFWFFGLALKGLKNVGYKSLKS